VACVHNGKYLSAPGFVCFYFPDSETRTYAAGGRPMEIGYGMGEVGMTVTDWPALFESLASSPGGLAGQLWGKYLTAEQRAALRKGGEQFGAVAAPLVAGLAKRRQAQEADQKALAELRAADAQARAAQQAYGKDPTIATKETLDKAVARRRAAQEARQATLGELTKVSTLPPEVVKAADEFVMQGRPELGGIAFKTVVENALGRMIDDPDLYVTHRPAIELLHRSLNEVRRQPVDALWQRYVGLGILRSEGQMLQLHALRSGSEPLAKRLSRYEKFLVQRLHAELLAVLIYPGAVAPQAKDYYVDQRLVTPGKFWRDVYRSDASGNPLGWMRYTTGGQVDFTAEGLVALARDRLGRPTQARAVQTIQPTTGEPVMGREVQHYEYDGPQDFKGRIKKSEVIDGAK
jgi:hypothetical protein